MRNKTVEIAIPTEPGPEMWNFVIGMCRIRGEKLCTLANQNGINKSVAYRALNHNINGPKTRAVRRLLIGLAIGAESGDIINE